MKLKQAFVLGVALALCAPLSAQRLPTAKPESLGLSSERLQRIGDTFQGYVDEGRIAGALYKGDRVAIMEDVVTRGVSPLEAAEVVRAFGAEPVMIIAIVDRGGTCEAMAKQAELKFFPLLTAPDLGFEYEGP